MEADDTGVIKRLVESGFGYSILLQFALGGRGQRFQRLWVPGRRLVRPRPLTLEIADFLKASLLK